MLRLSLKLSVFILIPIAARADMIDVLVPAYANPCCGGGINMWNELIATAGDPNREFQMHVIFNPASGPGVARDPNYVNASDQGTLVDYRNAGGSSHGYVFTSFGNRPINDVKSDIDKYLTGFYAGFVDGIFLDEMSNDLQHVSYYQQLDTYVKSQQAGARTFGNPGTTFVNNTTSQTTFDETDYMNSLDTIMTFENTDTEYANNYTSFPHVEGLDRQKIAHIVHSNSVWNSALLTTAANRGAGFLYVTDDPFQPDANPFDTLTSYWTQFEADVSAHNAAIPEPSSFLLVGLLGLAFITRNSRRRTIQGSKFVFQCG